MHGRLTMDAPDQPPRWMPPPDTSASVEIPDFVAEAVERLAERVHNRWAEKRLEEGWRWGPERSDQLKTTPNLVAYGELSEKDKDLDRATALATIRNLYQEGFRIVAADTPVDAGADDAALVEAKLAAPEALRFETVDALWRGYPAAFWQVHAGLGARLAKIACDAGWPLLAYDMASSLLTGEAPLSPAAEAGVRHIAVLSLMEVGAIERAAQELDKIGDGTPVDADLHGLRGRLAKMQGLRAKTPDDACRWFGRAREIYGAAYATSLGRFRQQGSRSAGEDAYYLGINAASLAAWSGHREEARRLAAEVLEICRKVTALSAQDEPQPWLQATRGEACLLLGEYSEAEAAYRGAAEALSGRWRALQSMRRQAMETAARTGGPVQAVDGWFKRPAMLIAGLGRRPVSCSSTGSFVFYYLREPSQLAEAEELARDCSELHLCFEAPLASFRAACGEEDLVRLDSLLARATRLHGAEDPQVAGEKLEPSMVHLLFRGACLLRGQELDLETGPASTPEDEELMTGTRAPFRAIVCADVKGFSRLDSRGLEIFCSELLGMVGKIADRFRSNALVLKTAGDGIFAVFRDLDSAVNFSLALRDGVASVDWTSRGLPDNLGIRISLDAGPVLEFNDPVTGRLDVAGRMVNRAARIEPITPVNHVYASRTAASLALSLGLPGVRFEYAGETPLPKGFGAFPLYHVASA